MRPISSRGPVAESRELSAGVPARKLAAIIGAGTLARLVLALLTRGQPFDMGSVEIVRHDLAALGLDVYGHVNVGNFHWPYPPGFFPWIALSGTIAGSHAHVFDVLIRLPTIAADAALAWLVQGYLRSRGATPGAQLAGAAAVAFGPIFLVVAGYHGQMDALAILPAVLALVVWERMDGERRSLAAGALIGLGGALKAVPLLMVLALAPTARSWRELAGLVGAAALVPLAALAPFFVAQPAATEAALRNYHGYPGQGGLTLVLQPGLARTWLLGASAHPFHLNGLVRPLIAHAQVVNLAIYGGVAAVLARYRPTPAHAASILWLATFVLSPAFFFQYLIWGLPFFVMAGYVRSAVLLQVAAIGPAVLYYLAPWSSDAPTYVFVSIMAVLWAWMLVWLVRLVGGGAGRRPPGDAGAPAAVAP
jgi:uncharacterized membrane protein